MAFESQEERNGKKYFAVLVGASVLAIPYGMLVGPVLGRLLANESIPLLLRWLGAFGICIFLPGAFLVGVGVGQLWAGRQKDEPGRIRVLDFSEVEQTLGKVEELLASLSKDVRCTQDALATLRKSVDGHPELSLPPGTTLLRWSLSDSNADVRTRRRNRVLWKVATTLVGLIVSIAPALFSGC